MSDATTTSPSLDLRIDARPEVGGYSWALQFAATASRGGDKLEYRAEGTLALPDAGPCQFEIKVRDRHRDVWTPMPLDQRSDLRRVVNVMLDGARTALKELGHS